MGTYDRVRNAQLILLARHICLGVLALAGLGPLQVHHVPLPTQLEREALLELLALLGRARHFARLLLGLVERALQEPKHASAALLALRLCLLRLAFPREFVDRGPWRGLERHVHRHGRHRRDVHRLVGGQRGRHRLRWGSLHRDEGEREIENGWPRQSSAVSRARIDKEGERSTRCVTLSAWDQRPTAPTSRGPSTAARCTSPTPSSCSAAHGAR